MANYKKPSGVHEVDETTALLKSRDSKDILPLRARFVWCSDGSTSNVFLQLALLNEVFIILLEVVVVFCVMELDLVKLTLTIGFWPIISDLEANEEEYHMYVEPCTIYAHNEYLKSVKSCVWLPQRLKFVLSLIGEVWWFMCDCCELFGLPNVYSSTS